MISRIKIAAAVFSLLVFLASVVIYFLNRPFIGKTFSYGAYYFILILFLFWVATLSKTWRHYRPDLKYFCRHYGRGLIFCVLACALVFISVKPRLRVLADETNLLAVSKSMTFERRVDNVTMGEWYYDNFHPLRRQTDKRPLLYPFLTHLLHTFTGFRPENAFAVNFILLAGLLSMVFILVRRTWGALWGYSAVLLVLANPVVTQGATCGGFDLSATFFTFAALVSLFYFLKTPGPLLFQLLWVNLLMLANTRYESPLFFMLIIPSLFFLRYVPFSFFEKAWVYPLTPLFVLPLVWQKMALASNPNLFEAAAHVKAFSLAHLIDHTLEWMTSAIRFDYFLPYAPPVALLGIAGLVYLSLKSFRGNFQKYQRHFVFISVFAILASWCVIGSYHFGTLSHPTSSRYFIFYYGVFSLAALYLLRKVPLVRRDTFMIFSVSVLLFLLYHPVSVENRFCNSQKLPRQDRIVADFLEKQGARNLLVIAERPGMYAARNYGAVNFSYANGNRESVLAALRRHLYRDIFVIQEILYEGMAPTKESALASQFQLSTILEQQHNATSFIRISRVRI